MTTVAGFNVNKQNINRNGRPKEPWTMSGLIKEALEEQDKTGVPKKLIIVRKLLEIAGTGDIVAIKEVNNRIDGMPKQSTDLTTNGKDLTFNNLTDEQLDEYIKGKARKAGIDSVIGGEGEKDSP